MFQSKAEAIQAYSSQNKNELCDPYLKCILRKLVEKLKLFRSIRNMCSVNIAYIWSIWQHLVTYVYAGRVKPVTSVPFLHINYHSTFSVYRWPPHHNLYKLSHHLRHLRRCLNHEYQLRVWVQPIRPVRRPILDHLRRIARMLAMHRSRRLRGVLVIENGGAHERKLPQRRECLQVIHIPR